MKTCTTCHYADWKKTKAGRLHPSGEGECVYKYKLPALPNSMYWDGCPQNALKKIKINRHKEYPQHCPYYAYF